MNKLLLTIFGFFTIFSTFAQMVINNSKTDNHNQIAGTKFFLVPPKGFIKATNFQGLQQLNTGASILVMEIPGPFTETTKGFTEQRLNTQGVVLKKKEDIKLNGYQGVLLTTDQFAHGVNFSKYILVFGDVTATYMVNGTFPKELTALDKAIRASMLSVIYDSTLIVDVLSAVPFTIDTDNTKLKFGKTMSGTLLYTVDGKVPTESSDKTSFVVGLSLANVQTVDKKLTAINRMKRLPYKDLKIDENKINEVLIDGVSGYEIVAEGLNNANEKKEQIYQVMLFTDNGYYIMIGTAKDDFEANLDLFKKVARSLKRK